MEGDNSMKPIKRIGQLKNNESNYEQDLEKIIENINNKIKIEWGVKTFSKFCYALDGMGDDMDERTILFLKSRKLTYLTSCKELKECEVILDMDHSSDLDLWILRYMLVNQDIMTDVQIDTLIESYKVMSGLIE